MASEYALAAGYNAVSLDLLIEITVGGKPLLSSVDALGDFDPGLERLYLNGINEDTGTASWPWVFAAMRPAEYGYFQTTYLGGVRSGPVTVRTKRLDGSYATFNAVLTLPKRGGLRMQNGHYLDVPFEFKQGVEI